MSIVEITVRKLDASRREVWSYPAIVLERAADHLLVEARFGRDRVDLGYVVFERGDRFLEWFYSDRWYNVFEVHSVRDDRLKGWYCNLTRPAVIGEREVSAEDLELDLWIDPGGQIILLDQEEYEALALIDAERREVAAAVEEITRLASQRSGPFGGCG